MKKMMMVLATLAMIGLATSQAWAQWGGPMMHRSWGYGNMYNNGNNTAFLNNTVKLRADLAAKKAEYNALMTQREPDPERAAQLSREISSLNEQLRIKSQEYATNNSGNNYTPMYPNMPMSPYGYGGWGCW